MLLVYTLFTFVSCFASFSFAADTSAWKSRSVYFVLTDRIARSNSDAGGNACGDLGTYCGGTFQGLESKLDYIKGLGFDAIWITPVVTSKLVTNIRDTPLNGLTTMKIRQGVTTDTGRKICIPSIRITAQQPI